jgi:hypothetical protein
MGQIVLRNKDSGVETIATDLLRNIALREKSDVLTVFHPFTMGEYRTFANEFEISVQKSI